MSPRSLKGQVGAAGSIGQDAVNGSEIYQKKIEITADAFLALIFEDAEGVVVTCNAEEGFKAAPLARVSSSRAKFMCTLDGRRRQSAQRRTAAPGTIWCSPYAIVLDDIGTKVDRAKLKGRLEPTFKCRTSMPGGSVSNEQWWYVFQKGVAPARANALDRGAGRRGPDRCRRQAR